MHACWAPSGPLSKSCCVADWCSGTTRRQPTTDCRRVKAPFSLAAAFADAYVLTGRLADAQRLYERLVGLCNDVGLLAEEYDVGAQRAVGNFPQAFSHIALVNTAYNIAATKKPCERRSGSPRVDPGGADDLVLEALTARTGRDHREAPE